VTNFALAYAPLKSYLVAWDDENDIPRCAEFELIHKDKILSLSEVLVFGRPILEHFKPGDRLYTEMGGGSDVFLLNLLECQIGIFRIPVGRLALLLDDTARTKLVGEKNSQQGQKDVQSREIRARFLMKLAVSQSDEFFKMRSADPTIWQIQALVRSFTKVQQELRIKTTQRVRQMQMDVALLPKCYCNKQVGKIKELLADQDHLDYYRKLERSYARAIEKTLENLPIWVQVLKPIRGIGPSIAGRIISVIGDIRRFPRLAGFRAYVGWFVTSDDKAPRLLRRKPGEMAVSDPKFSPKGQQAFWLTGDQFIKSGSECEYNHLYYERREYYETRDQEQSENPSFKIVCHLRARRSMISTFVDDLWKSWWRVLEAEGEPIPDSVRMVLYPMEYKVKRYEQDPDMPQEVRAAFLRAGDQDNSLMAV